MILLAGDIGGTNTRLALFEVDARANPPIPAPIPRFERTYLSASHAGLDAIAENFLNEAHLPAPPERACFGIAGPVENNVCRATNLPWIVDGQILSRRLSIEKVRLVNDFHAAALGCINVPPSALAAVGGAPRDPRGPIAALGAGTGLGVAFLLWSEAAGRYQVVSSEGGHVDFAPRTPLERDLLGYLTAKYGRVSYERVLSGHGLADVYAFLSDEPAFRALVRAETTAAMAAGDPAPVITQMALEGSDPVCTAALTLFCDVLGALAGNLALTLLATGGVFVAGGIAPRIVPFLQKGGFREAFEHKGRMQSLVARIPVFVVTHAQPGLLGAATAAAAL